MKIRYRIEIKIRRGVVRRVRQRGMPAHTIWEPFECSGRSLTTRCVTQRQADKMFDRLLQVPAVR